MKIPPGKEDQEFPLLQIFIPSSQLHKVQLDLYGQTTAKTPVLRESSKKGELLERWSNGNLDSVSIWGKGFGGDAVFIVVQGPLKETGLFNKTTLSTQKLLVFNRL